MGKKVNILTVIGKVLFIVVLASDIIFRFLSGRILPDCDLNQGVAFGVRVMNEEFIVLLVLIVLTVYLVFLYRNSKQQGVLKTYLPMLWGFGIVNFVDRLTSGGVCDYIKIPFINLSFNLADVGITTVIVLIIYQILKDEKN